MGLRHLRPRGGAVVTIEATAKHLFDSGYTEADLERVRRTEGL